MAGYVIVEVDSYLAWRDALLNSVSIEEVPDVLYWNNTNGWGDRAGATVFTKEEKENFWPPYNGVWVKKNLVR